MPEPIVSPVNAPAPAAPASPAPSGQPADGFKMPEKFASAKPEDIAKAYVELESKLGEQGKKLGVVSEYEKLGSPKEVSEALQWARDQYARIQRGELIPKSGQASASPAAGPAGPQAPWQAEGWDFLPPAEQAAKMAQYNQQAVMSQVTDYVNKLAAQYGQQIEGFRSTQSREQSLMLKAIQGALKSGGQVDLQAALEKAAEMATKSPEEFIEMAMQSIVNPKAQEQDIEAKVTARVAEELQKRSNQQIDELNRHASPVPRFAQQAFKDRNAENRAIVENLNKQGINLS